MAQVIIAPNELYTLYSETETKLFLAGGITDCPDWQADFIREFRNTNKLVISSPRRPKKPESDKLEEQIVWEHRHLREADIVVFWFSEGSVNPITLYELGLMLTSDKVVVIGVHPDYTKKDDVIIQSRLIRDIMIAKNFEQLIALTRKELAFLK